MFVESAGELENPIPIPVLSKLRKKQETRNKKHTNLLQFVGWIHFTIWWKCVYTSKHIQTMHTLLNRAPRAKCTSRNSLCTWPVNILSCVFCHNSPLASNRFQYVFIIHYTSSNPTPQALEIVETPVLPAQILGPAAFEINRLHWPWWCQFSSCQRVGSPSSPPLSETKRVRIKKPQGYKKRKGDLYKSIQDRNMYIYIYI